LVSFESADTNYTQIKPPTVAEFSQQQEVEIIRKSASSSLSANYQVEH